MSTHPRAQGLRRKFRMLDNLKKKLEFIKVAGADPMQVLNQAFLVMPKEEQDLIKDSLTRPIRTFGDMLELNFHLYFVREHFGQGFDTLIDRNFEVFMDGVLIWDEEDLKNLDKLREKQGDKRY